MGPVPKIGSACIGVLRTGFGEGPVVSKNDRDLSSTVILLRRREESGFNQLNPLPHSVACSQFVELEGGSGGCPAT